MGNRSIISSGWSGTINPSPKAHKYSPPATTTSPGGHPRPPLANPPSQTHCLRFRTPPRVQLYTKTELRCVHPIPLSCPLLASGLPLLPNRPCKSIRRAGLVAGSGLVRDPVNHGRPQPTRANVPSDPYHLAAAFWLALLTRPPGRSGLSGRSTPYKVLHPRPPLLLPLTPLQSNKTLPGPIHPLSSYSSPSHLTLPTSPISSSTTSSKVERKVRQLSTPTTFFFPPPLVRATSLSSRPCPSQPPLNVYRRLPRRCPICVFSSRPASRD